VVVVTSVNAVVDVNAVTYVIVLFVCECLVFVYEWLALSVVIADEVAKSKTRRRAKAK